MTRVIADPDDAAARALVLFQPAFLVGMALAESIALFGAMIGMMGGQHVRGRGLLPRVARADRDEVPAPPGETVVRALEQAKNARCPLVQ